ncbi:MAG: GerMN domain-containing protein, partial [Thermoanaerobaculia bacterium]
PVPERAHRAARPEAPRGALFPAPVRVDRLILVDGTAYVDLRPEDGGEPPSTGSTLELLRVYSIVHTLVRNVPEVRQVVLLWNGVQRRGFPGHVDTARPLVPMASLEGS